MLLGVNIDHIATLREARGTDYPNPLTGAMLAIYGGADFITMHLREDRRHIQDQDVFEFKEKLPVRLNLEIATTEEMVQLATEVKPSDVCLVPEKRLELTTEGGLDVIAQAARVTEAVHQLQSAGITVSLFVDPDPLQINAAVKTGTTGIEIHTGHYADALTAQEQEQRLEKIMLAVRHALKLGLNVNAGHGLNLKNLAPIVGIEGISELNIGHSIIARSVMVGMREAVGEVRSLMDRQLELIT